VERLVDDVYKLVTPESIRPKTLPRSFSQYEFPKEVVDERRKKFFSDMPEGQDDCYIAPREQFDIILASRTHSPESLAQSLLQALY
jgi:hypothetical protein